MKTDVESIDNENTNKHLILVRLVLNVNYHFGKLDNIEVDRARFKDVNELLDFG
jgi:hypothetical protein